MDIKQLNEELDKVLNESNKVTQKMTKDYANALSIPILIVPDGSLQNLLRFENIWGHTERTYGWGCDIYYLNGAMVSTGYAPFGNIKVKYDLCKKYDEEASKIIEEYPLSSSWDNMKQKLSELQDEFIQEAITNN